MTFTPAFCNTVLSVVLIKIMEKSEYRRKTGKWFRGKEGKTNTEIRNIGGGIIKKGETIIFRGKSGKGGFNIMSKENGVWISQVGFEKIDFDFSQNDR